MDEICCDAAMEYYGGCVGCDQFGCPKVNESFIVKLNSEQLNFIEEEE